MNEQDIKQEVVDHLIWDDRILANEINVDYDQGEIMLKGEVGNIMSKRMAEKKAYQVDGVNQVNNQLIVDNRASHRPDDHDLKETLERNFYWNDHLDYSDLQVAVKNNKVTITGTVDALWKKNLAQELAENVKGTIDVDNKITIAKNKNNNDSQIAQAVRGALKRHHNLPEENIEVIVASGFVTLKGQVKNRDQNMQAYETALYTRGVTGIDNQLIIKNDTQNTI